MVLAKIDSSGILMKPLKDRSAKELTCGYMHLIKRLQADGVQPKKHLMDNKFAEMMRDTIKKECKLELVPPGCY